MWLKNCGLRNISICIQVQKVLGFKLWVLGLKEKSPRRIAGILLLMTID
jgi:hypothetical protein